MHHRKQEVLNRPPHLWKSKHLACHHRWSQVEKARRYVTNGTKTEAASPASRPPTDQQAVPQELTQMSADTKTDAAAADRWCFTAGFLSRVMRGSDHRQAKGYMHQQKNFHCTVSHPKDSFMLITISLSFLPVIFLQSSNGLLWPKDQEKAMLCLIQMHKERQEEFFLKFSAVSARSGPTSKPCVHFLASRASGVNKLITGSSDSLIHSFNIPYAGHRDRVRHNSMTKPS